MQRLTYAPKAFIFIQSSNLGGRIYDVSADIVSGSVTQNLGDTSSLEFTLRNRFKKYIRDPDSGKTIFLPMDLVTCWLQKTPGNPIQQFTGYLDAVPYYQGYPGDAPFSATCTLKKLAFTWFDPGLAFFQNWMVANGWIYDPTSGQAYNPTLNWQSQTSVDPQNPFSTNMNDGGFARLLGQFMVDVAQWDPHDIMISNLPPNLSKQAAKLFTTINTTSAKALDDLDKFFAKAMGMQVPVTTSTNTTITPTQAAPANPALQMRDAMAGPAKDKNIPLLVLAFAACALTNFNQNYRHDIQDDKFGYGLYALRPNVVFSGTQPLDPNAVDGVLISDLNNVATSSKLMATRLAKHPGSWVQGAKNNDLASIKQWIELAIGYSLPAGIDYTTVFNVAQEFTGTTFLSFPNQYGHPILLPSDASWTNTKVQLIASALDEKVISQYYIANKSGPWLAALFYQVKSLVPDVRLAIPPDHGVNDLAFAGSDIDLQKVFNAFAGRTDIDSVFWNGSDGQQVLRNGKASQNIPFTIIAGGGNGFKGLWITQAREPASAGTPVPSLAADFPANKNDSVTSNNASGGNTQTSNISWTDMARFSATSAFAANFAFPSDIIQSTLLTGKRALMNDWDCLKAVKQLAGASMRTFRSLPDGRFLAFYPDYFGAYRPPYYKISNIELINFGITLNDEQLVTHMYVTGDTLNFNNQIDLMEQVTTHGVATLTDAFMLESFIEPYDPKQVPSDVGALSNAFDFLNHYGARPLMEEDPMIRNGAFEFLLAWQRFMQHWAAQFVTTIDVTFSPEIQAGGIIEFPDHDLQMFVESVTHRWDYASGFTTEAVMSAPSIPKGKRHDKVFKPGFALSGGTLTVGAGSGG